MPKALVKFKRKHLEMQEMIYSPFSQAFSLRWESNISLCSICRVSAVVGWDHRSGMGHSKVLQLHSSGRERNQSLLRLARSPNAGQYFQRLCDCSSTSLQKCLRFPQLWLNSLPSVPMHHDRTPLISIQGFSKAEFPFLHLRWHTLSFLFLRSTNPCTTSMVRVTRAGERERSAVDSPKEP